MTLKMVQDTWPNPPPAGRDDNAAGPNPSPVYQELLKPDDIQLVIRSNKNFKRTAVKRASGTMRKSAASSAGVKKAPAAVWSITAPSCRRVKHAFGMMIENKLNVIMAELILIE
jgi:hypothetical protein